MSTRIGAVVSANGTGKKLQVSRFCGPGTLVERRMVQITIENQSITMDHESVGDLIDLLNRVWE